MKTKLHLTYLNDSDLKIEALLELPNNPDLVISKLKIKVGSQEIRAALKEKERAHEQYDDAIASGYQAVMLEQKENEEEKLLQMRVGNVEPKQIIEVEISFIEQAQVFEGACQIVIPRGLVLMLTEFRENSNLNIEINCSAPISKIYCP